jgi:HK97 family phage prohead protease
MDAETLRDLNAVMRKFSEVKHLQATIAKSPTDGSGTFVAIVSTFGPPPDVQNDIITPGAFKASLMDATVRHPGALFPVLWQHDYEDPESVIGLVTAAAETKDGLAIAGRLDLTNQRAVAVYEGMLGDRIREWSIGYGIEEKHWGEWNGDSVRFLDKLELLEISAVVKGANRFTRTIEVRSDPAYATSTAGSTSTVTWTTTPAPDPELAEINARLDALASGEKLRDPAIADQVEELVLDVREELIRESLDRAEQAAWERRMHINLVLDPVPVRVDARMRPVTS